MRPRAGALGGDQVSQLEPWTMLSKTWLVVLPMIGGLHRRAPVTIDGRRASFCCTRFGDGDLGTSRECWVAGRGELR